MPQLFCAAALHCRPHSLHRVDSAEFPRPIRKIRLSLSTGATSPASGRETEVRGDSAEAARAATAAIVASVTLFRHSHLLARRCSMRTSRRMGGFWEAPMLPRIPKNTSDDAGLYRLPMEPIPISTAIPWDLPAL